MIYSLESRGQAFPLVGQWTAWKIGSGKNIRIGKDPWLGAGDNFVLSLPPVQALADHEIITLNDAKSDLPQPRGRAGWISANALNLQKTCQMNGTPLWVCYVKTTLF
jgi:hypothetical protein